VAEDKPSAGFLKNNNQYPNSQYQQYKHDNIVYRLFISFYFLGYFHKRTA